MQKKEQPEQPHQLRPQIYSSLNLQYKSHKFTSLHRFHEMVDICESSLRAGIYSYLYELTLLDISKYGMQIRQCQVDPFADGERDFLRQLAQVCDKVIEEPGYASIQKINSYVKEGKLGQLRLNQFYRKFQLNFRYVCIKQALVYTCLSQCNVWYIIMKNRKKSKKQFDLDPLVKYFQTFVGRLKLQNPYHIDILPKKQVKNIERKVNKQKVGNQLFQAVSNGDHERVRQLLLNGAKIQKPAFLNNRQRNEVRCVHKACLMGDLRMCKLLDSFGANWEAEDSQLMTPIFYAIQSSNMEVIKYLTQQLKVNIQKQQIQKRTPFYWACTQGDINIIDYFYKMGCNINHKSQLGRTALSKSCYLGRRDIVMYLLKCKQIDMLSQCKKGRTALHNAVFGPKGGRQGHKFGTNEKDSPQCAQILLQNGMNVDILDFQDCTSLHIAMSSQAIDSIRLLLAYGASLTPKNNYGQTPLMTGAKFGHVAACKILHEEYNADILCIDIFQKNLLLLTAKFQQNSEDGTINPVFTYFLNPFIQKCLECNKLKQLHRTFCQLIQSQFAQKMIVQITHLCEAFKTHKVPIPQLSITQTQKLLQLSLACSSALQKSPNLKDQSKYLQLSIQILRQLHLPKQKLQALHIWLIKRNQPKILEFVHEHQLLGIERVEIGAGRYFGMIEDEELGLKEKVVSFCMLSLAFDWVGYKNKEGCNILHLLVRKQRSGCIVQLFKALSHKIPPKILTNPYIANLPQESTPKVIQQLLWQKDESGLDPHQLSLILKNKSVAKLIEEKLKEQHLEFSSVLDVKEYEAVLEDDAALLEGFNGTAHEREEELAGFEERVSKWTHQQVFQWCNSIKNCLSTVKSQQLCLDHPNRPLILLTDPQQLASLQILQKQQMLGLDIQYFSHESITLISTLQISTLKQDYIIDCLALDIKLIAKYLQPVIHDVGILKIMHGADNDIILLRSLFNLCMINFLDTSRLDVELRENKYDLRGLATLTKQYLNISMSKEYQVSQWRIRPIPKAMLQYARKDSMILPYLLVEMLSRINSEPERIRQFIIGGCKQCRRNKKSTQPLIKGVRVVGSE